MNRRFRMISLISEALELEIEEALEMDEEYEEIFRKDFAEVTKFLMERHERKIDLKIDRTREGQHREKESSFEDFEEMQTSNKPEIASLKKIYRALARKTHPDVAGEESEEEFKEIQTAFTEGKVSKILSAANKNGVSAELTEEELDELRYFVKLQKIELKELRKTVRWAWAKSERDEDTRRLIMISMGVNPGEFYSWKEAQLMQRIIKEKEVQRAQREKQAQEQRRERAERKRKRNQNRNRGPNPTRQRDLRRSRDKKNKKKS